MGVGRRLFLKAAACIAFVAAVPKAVWAFFVKELQVRTVEKTSFSFDPSKGLLQWRGGKGTEPYTLLVDGLVDKAISFSYAELKALPQTGQTSDFHCVEGWSVKDLHWGGFRFQEILKRIKVKPEAHYAVFHSLGTTSPQQGLDHYVECFSIDELTDPRRQVLLALTLNGRPLSFDQGAPLRVVSPFQQGYKGAKFVTRIEFVRERRPGWWTVANPIYDVEGTVPGNRLRKKP